MLGRKREGSVVCPGCGSLVGVNDDKCYMCGRVNPSLWGYAPLLRRLGQDMGFVPLVIGVCSVLYAVTLIASGSIAGGGGVDFMAPSGDALLFFGASGAEAIFGYGRWWSVLSASWLHGSFLHILFNMMSLRQIGPAAVDIIGPGRTIIIYVLSGVCGFALSSIAYMYFPPLPFLHGARLTVGASASIFGLFGALYHYGQKSGSRLISGQIAQWVIIILVYGLVSRGVDNFAHLGGFAGGYLLSSFFNPLTKERGDHMLAAVACLVASFLAIAYPVLRWLLLISAS